MALIFQEVLTIVVRLRGNRQRFGDIEVFRTQIRNAFKTAEQDGLRRGYGLEDMRAGTLAIVAFLDESILNSRNAAFTDWQDRPLQEELFGVRIAGEIFFRDVERLLGRPDSEPLADLLEVHQLCILLGFRGRYSVSGTAGEVRSILQQIEEKIRRIRGAPVTCAWQFTPRAVRAASGQGIRIFRWVAIGCALLALLLFVFFKLSLSSAAGELGRIAARNPS
jgi:type VI secretion system protein ImpK